MALSDRLLFSFRQISVSLVKDEAGISFLESDDGPASKRTRVSQFFRPERFPDRVAGEKDQGGGQPQAPDHREVQTFGSDSNLSKNQQPA